MKKREASILLIEKEIGGTKPQPDRREFNRTVLRRGKWKKRTESSAMLDANISAE